MINRNIPEVWIDVANFPNHMVSSLGRVRNWTSGVTLRPRFSGWGYLQVVFYRDGKTYTKSVHRLVAEAFFGTYDYLEVNHIDGDKANNYVGNLEWVTKGQNNQHAIDSGLRRPRKGTKVEIVEIDKRFDTMKSCAEFLGCHVNSLVYSVYRSKSGKYKGHTIRLINDG